MSNSQEDVPPATQSQSKTLAHILDNEIEDDEDTGLVDEKESEEEAEAVVSRPAREGFCVECEDQEAELFCETCADAYCSVCYHSQHRKGNRKRHVYKPLNEGPPRKKVKREAEPTKTSQVPATDTMDTTSDIVDNDAEDASAKPPAIIPESSTFADIALRAKFIPLRLTFPERKYLRLLEAALTVSEYTDRIDILLPYGKSRTKRMVSQIKEICAIMSGLTLAADYKQGQELFENRNFAHNSVYFQRIFELGRRFKIMNPDKMRTTYGKLMYLLQDSQIPEVKELLGFSTVIPIVTVYSTLEEGGALGILEEELIYTATSEIRSIGRTRREIQADTRAKERAIERLAAKYVRNSKMEEEDIKQCLYSLGDSNSFLRVNREPCERLIDWLQKYFHPTKILPGASGTGKATNLSIRFGKDGSRLTHGHEQQYSYVIQSLTLWKEILGDMFHLWHLAEQDLLSEDISYRLRDTGQGLNRVQGAPKTGRKMHAILHRAQTSIGHWVGSSVIHLGDHNVPNALMFLDKYTQVYRITLPICNVLDQIPKLMKNPSLAAYIEAEYGSEDALYEEILGDFFRHAFNGSGADNSFDAGSCIDGRLTSAWEWCSKLEKKRFYHIFLLSGFVSFDGDW